MRMPCNFSIFLAVMVVTAAPVWFPRCAKHGAVVGTVKDLGSHRRSQCENHKPLRGVEETHAVKTRRGWRGHFSGTASWHLHADGGHPGSRP